MCVLALSVEPVLWRSTWRQRLAVYGAVSIYEVAIGPAVCS